MRNGKRLCTAAVGWSLALLFCGVLLYWKITGAVQLRQLQRAVFGVHPEQVEAAFSAIRRGETAVEVISLAN